MIKVKKIKPPKMSLSEKLYLPNVLRGMGITARHLPKKKFTVQYPEEKWVPRPGYRGAHRLNKDEEGRIKCVACEMCSAACPANCIHIIGGVSPWDDREKYPVVFEIDMLRCIYCGMCEEACPREAIELTQVYDFAAYSREDLVWDKQKLLEMFDLTKDNNYYETRTPRVVKT
ncbi:4Fe-4S dicluster domain-containing protein, partial [Candidatus Saccharibacteria bacterium]|nr:4Fe-4S dicluster domain-containing protein [Calditrichia bacterium]NIV97763.1 4Fe-4S dicluster domain-containing protein [Candidatus Saccharibacteria bacterium]